MSLQKVAQQPQSTTDVRREGKRRKGALIWERNGGEGGREGGREGGEKERILG